MKKADEELLYIRKSCELIKSMPILKKEIVKMKENLSESSTSEELNKLKQLTVLLQFFINCLKQCGTLGEILIDIYFNELSRKETALKYRYTCDTLCNMLNARGKSLNQWNKLSILLYGAHSVRLEVVRTQEESEAIAHELKIRKQSKTFFPIK